MIRCYDTLLTVLSHKINYILLMDYKFLIPNCDIVNTRFIGLEACVIGK